MNDVRGWIQRKLQEQGYSSVKRSHLQLDIERASFPDARVLCIGLSDGESIDAEDIDSLVEALPGTRFVVVVPTRISHAAYERAEERGICIAGFGELIDALMHDEDISQHVDSQERYERSRLLHNRAVQSLRRKGHHAYEVQRHRLRPLTVITTNVYEFTVDELYSLLESYQGIEPDLIVVTNPNCRGFSGDSLRAADQVGIPIILFDELLDDLDAKWS